MLRNPFRLRAARLLTASALLLALSAAALAQAKQTPVDLQPKANHRLTDDLHKAAGNHLGNVPQGDLRFEEVTFKVGEQMVHVGSKQQPDVPDHVDGIKVEATFHRLHILHSTGYGEAPQVPDGLEIGAYTVHYADNTTERIPIVYGEDLRDWWAWPPRTETKRAKVAWLGTNPNSAANECKIRLFATTWENPHPEKKVATLDLSSNNTDCDPFLVALTLEKK